MMMTGCDLSAITKPWEVQSKVCATLVIHCRIIQSLGYCELMALFFSEGGSHGGS